MSSSSSSSSSECLCIRMSLPGTPVRPQPCPGCGLPRCVNCGYTCERPGCPGLSCHTCHFISCTLSTPASSESSSSSSSDSSSVKCDTHIVKTSLYTVDKKRDRHQKHVNIDKLVADETQTLRDAAEVLNSDLASLVVLSCGMQKKCKVCGLQFMNHRVLCLCSRCKRYVCDAHLRVCECIHQMSTCRDKVCTTCISDDDAEDDNNEQYDIVCSSGLMGRHGLTPRSHCRSCVELCPSCSEGCCRKQQKDKRCGQCGRGVCESCCIMCQFCEVYLCVSQACRMEHRRTCKSRKRRLLHFDMTRAFDRQTAKRQKLVN